MYVHTQITLNLLGRIHLKKEYQLVSCMYVVRMSKCLNAATLMLYGQWSRRGTFYTIATRYYFTLVTGLS